MYAVIATGGKQYKVTKGETLRVEKLDGEEGSTVELDNVLMVADGDKVEVGKPHVNGASVTAEIVAQDLAKKIIVFKMKRRKGYRNRRGHRQPYTELRIESVKG